MRTLLAIVLCSFSARAGEPQDLMDQSLEQLMNTRVVSVSKKEQSLKTSAASVFVITSEDIRRSGMHSLPELLRMAPGVQVARTVSGHWAISIRGFNSDFANKLLVMMDGRVIYNEEWAGVYWDMEEISLPNIDRIEVIRGPGAAMWGANAVNGVINIFTKTAEATQGGLLAVEKGNADDNLSLRYGGKIGSDAFYRITAQHGGYDPLAAAATVENGGFLSSTGWTSDSANFRVDWKPTAKDEASFSGQFYQSTTGEPLHPITPANPLAPTEEILEHSVAGFGMGKWDHTYANGSSLQAKISWDHTEHGVGALPVGANTAEVEIQYNFSLGSRNEVVWGVDYRLARYHSSFSPGHSVEPQDADLDSYGTFFEDQITLVPNQLFFIAGANIGHNRFTGMEIQPTGRLLWTPTKKLTTWASVSRAVRTPSLIELGMNFNLAPVPLPSGTALATLVGNPEAGAESVLAYEAGQRWQAGKKLSLDVSVFWNRYQHLLFFEATPPVLVFGMGAPTLELPTTFDNVYHGTSYGTEVAATWSATSRWRLTGGYSLLHVNTAPYPGWLPPSRPINNSPQHQWELRSNWDITRKIQVDTALYYTGSIPEDTVPQHLRGDVRVGWRPGEKTELSAGIQDAFQPQHAELPSLYQGQQLLVGRNVYGAMTWRF